MKTKDLDSLRQEIDQINLELIQLIEKRVLLVEEIFKIKKDLGQAFYDPVREEQMLAALNKHLKNSAQKDLTIEIFKSILRSIKNHYYS